MNDFWYKMALKFGKTVKNLYICTPIIVNKFLNDYIIFLNTTHII